MTCTSTALREHIGRAYLQTNLWMTATQPNRPIIVQADYYGWDSSKGTIFARLLPKEHRSDHRIYQNRVNAQNVLLKKVCLQNSQDTMLSILCVFKEKGSM